MAIRYLLLTLVLTTSGMAAAQFKCTEKGKVVYQDQACAGGESTEKLRLNAPPEISPGSAGTDRVTAMKQQADSMESMRLALEQGRPLVGMTAAQLQMAMGSPTRVNTSNYNGRASDQRIYERGGRTIYVYTDARGSVTAFQDQAAIDLSKKVAPRQGIVAY